MEDKTDDDRFEYVERWFPNGEPSLYAETSKGPWFRSFQELYKYTLEVEINERTRKRNRKTK